MCTVNHEALWIKLVKAGISCKVLRMIKAIYMNVKSCVRNSRSMSLSELFDVSLGVKQGEPLSPLLFILFINDISDSLNLDNLATKDIELLSIYMLLFADDIALFTTDANSLQALLDNVYEYSVKWGLKINVNKTKVCIFEKRKSRHDFIWKVNDEIIEIVDSFTYLGIRFYYTGCMKHAIQALYEQALKAYYHLLSIFSRVSLDVKTKLSLLDSMISPILLYRSEVWGIYNYKDFDRLNIKFCKYSLGVKPQTSTAAVFGELGRYSLVMKCKERALKYWVKIMKSPNTPIHTFFAEQQQNDARNRTISWASNVKSLLDNLGFGYLWNSLNVNSMYAQGFKQRLQDQYMQDWSTSIANQPKLSYYRLFKCEHKYEMYLDIVDNTVLRKSLSRFRLSSHSLEIETGRYTNVERNNRICRLCNMNVVESEYPLCCVVHYTETLEKHLD